MTKNCWNPSLTCELVNKLQRTCDENAAVAKTALVLCLNWKAFSVQFLGKNLLAVSRSFMHQHSIGKSGFRFRISDFGFRISDFGFPNKMPNPKTDFDEQKSFSKTDFNNLRPLNWNPSWKRISVCRNPFLDFAFYWEIQNPKSKFGFPNRTHPYSLRFLFLIFLVHFFALHTIHHMQTELRRESGVNI